MRHLKTFACLAVLSASAAGAGESAPDGRAAFDRIKKLAGTWEGNVATGARCSRRTTARWATSRS
jgi:hypothetical protein